MDEVRAGALVVSLDFELHWGVHDKLALAVYRDNLLGVRAAVPALLDTFRTFDIHATWATVGMLFFENKRELLDGLPAARPAYVRRELSPYALLDEVGEDERRDPLHFAPSLVRQIAAAPHQEIGTHTFSHYYCLEAGQSPVEFRADLEAAARVMRAKIGRVPASIVFPRNQVSAAYLAVCRELGYVAYRGNRDAWAFRPRRDGDESFVRRGFRLADTYLPLAVSNGRTLDAATSPVDLPASRYLRPYRPALRSLDGLRIRRIVLELRAAARHGQLFHLWWHPHDFGRHLRENLAVLHAVLREFAALRARYGMESLAMGEAAARALTGH